MVVIFRVILLTILGLIRGVHRGPLDDSTIRLTALPTDIDLYRHLNNGRYMSLSDLGRLDLALGSGMYRVMMKNRWFPVVATSMVRFRRSINLFERFTLRTRVVGWDQKWIYIVHWFEVGPAVSATILIKAVFLHGREPIAPHRLLEEIGVTAEKERVPEWIRHWLDTEQKIKPALNLQTEGEP